MMPCVDGCAPDECHGRPVMANVHGSGTHQRGRARYHNGPLFDYCLNCLARIKYVNGRWETDIVVKEWP